MYNNFHELIEIPIKLSGNTIYIKTISFDEYKFLESLGIYVNYAAINNISNDDVAKAHEAIKNHNINLINDKLLFEFAKANV